MATYQVSAGELRTQITLQYPALVQDAGAAQVPGWANATANPIVRARWVNAHGQEGVSGGQKGVSGEALKSVQRAVVTIRHRTDVLTTWRVLKDGVAQVETATVVGTITGSGSATVIVTAAGMTGTPKTISVAVLAGDTASQVAGKIRTALGLDAAVIALFTVGGTGATVTLTRAIPAANDGTLNISVDNGTCTGLTAVGTSANTTAGVIYDSTWEIISVDPVQGRNHWLEMVVEQAKGSV